MDDKKFTLRKIMQILIEKPMKKLYQHLSPILSLNSGHETKITP
jgi:hypothetical protein